MKFGVMNSHFVDPHRAVKLAVGAETLGYDSFWNTDFALGPHPDSMALLSAASQRTERITLGTAVMVLPYRHPVAFAKSIATLDALSKGRLVVGLGVGSNEREFDALGLDIHQRGRMAEEKLVLLRRLLTGERVTYRGEFHQLEDVHVGPTSVRRPGPPLWLGPLWKDGLAEATLKRTGRLGDGFIPSSVPASRYAEQREKVRVYAEKEGRDPDEIEFSAILWFCLDDDRERAWETLEAQSNRWKSDRPTVRGEANASGHARDLVEAIEEYREAGVSHLVLNAAVPPNQAMEQYEQFEREVLPVV